jgi:glucose/arabinose dehydrogenase/PKD repeat protein
MVAYSGHRLFMRLLGLFVGAILCGGGGMLLSPALYAAGSVASLPPNFQMRTVVSGLNYPTDMVLLPEGDILVTEKGTGLAHDGVAHVRLVRQGVLVAEPVLSLSVMVEGDSGLMSILLDPAFDENHYFYLWYSVGEHAKAWSGNLVNRLSRFIFEPQSGKADPLSETIILDGVRWGHIHNGGGLGFDAVGNLLIATGDTSRRELVQDTNSLNGKLLRVRPGVDGGYSVPEDNPFVNVEGTLPEIYALGLRNPFRMVESVEGHAQYLVDVGENNWEEVNLVTAGANYGWPVREGPCPLLDPGGDCPPAEEIYTDPLVYYRHPPGVGGGITALDFYSGEAWPEPYRGKLFFSDFNSTAISLVDLDEPETIMSFGKDIVHAVDMEATAEGLYILAFFSGEIRFIYYSEGGNQWPTAHLSASPLQGTAPLSVTLSAAGSTDPENDALSYLWDFGDGSVPVTTTEATIAHSYTSDGSYRVSLQVVDAHGGESEVRNVMVEVYSGEMPEIQYEIVGDSGREEYRGGDSVRFGVEREGGATGLDATTPYIWSVKQHHNQHIHFILTEVADEEVLLEIPDDGHAADVSLWYEAELTMLTAQGQKVRVTQALYPDIVSLDVHSSPSGASMLWNGEPQDRTQPIDAVVGQSFVLEAPEILYHGNSKHRFMHWEIISDGEAGGKIIPERSIEVLVTTEDNSYVAHYEYVGPSYAGYLPTVENSAFAPVE